MTATATDRRNQLADIAALRGFARRTVAFFESLQTFTESTSPILGNMDGRIREASLILARVPALNENIVRAVTRRVGTGMPPQLAKAVTTFIADLGRECQPDVLEARFHEIFETLDTLPPAQQQAVIQRLVGASWLLCSFRQGNAAIGVTRRMGLQAFSVGYALRRLLGFYSPNTVSRGGRS